MENTAPPPQGSATEDLAPDHLVSSSPLSRLSELTRLSPTIQSTPNPGPEDLPCGGSDTKAQSKGPRGRKLGLAQKG